MRRLLLTIPVLASLALFCALAAPTANAQESPVYWESLNVLIDIKQNGDLLVQETHVYAFRGQVSPERFRYIDMEKVDQIDRVSVSPWTAGNCRWKPNGMARGSSSDGATAPSTPPKTSPSSSATGSGGHRNGPRQ